MRVHYFFSEDDFLNEPDIRLEFRLTTGLNWNSYVALGHINPLENLWRYSESRVQTQSYRVFLFSKNLQSKCELSGVIGLKRDYKLRQQDLQYCSYKGLFVPEESYHTSDPLPIEWIEVIDKREMHKKDRKSEESFDIAKEIVDDQIEKLRESMPPILKRPWSGVSSKVSSYRKYQRQVDQVQKR